MYFEEIQTSPMKINKDKYYIGKSLFANNVCKRMLTKRWSLLFT